MVRTYAREHQIPEPPGRARLAGPWLIMLAILVVAFLGLLVIPTYATLDPARARIVLSEHTVLHYLALLVHIVTGTAAMLTGLIQLSPRTRQRHPAVHRLSGRIYLTAVLVGSLAITALIAFRSQTPGEASRTGSTIVIGFSFLTVLWVGTTVAGFRHARQRRYQQHRRMMTYSFALTLSIIWSRVAHVVALAVPGLGTTWIGENTGWLWWVSSLLIAHWWLHRTAGPVAVGPGGPLEAAATVVSGDQRAAPR